MNNELNQYERVQNYLRGRMSDEDKAAFERDLAKDDFLRQEYEDLSLLARSIIIANKEADLRIALNEYENNVTNSLYSTKDKTTLNRELDGVENELRKIGVVRHHWLKWVSYAVAASLVIFAVPTAYLGYNAQKVGYIYNPPTGIKGSSEIESLMEKKENKAAILKIKESRTWIEKERENPMYNDPSYLDDLDIQRQELDFLEAICQLRRGHYFSGKKMLIKIVNDGGTYANDAQTLLNEF